MCSSSDDDSLRDLLLHVQRHTHSIACKKHGQACRFHFPRHPVRKTVVVKPPEEEIPPVKQELYKEILAAVHDQLDRLDHESDMSIDKLLENANVSGETLHGGHTMDKN